MNEQVVGQPVLDPQRKAIEGGVLVVAPLCVHVVHGKHDFFPEQFVVIGKQGSVEMQELVVPQNMENLRLGCGSVADQLGVVAQNPCGLVPQADVRILVAPEFQESHPRNAPELRTVELITRDQVQKDSLRAELGCQSKHVGFITPSCKQAHCNALVGFHCFQVGQFYRFRLRLIDFNRHTYLLKTGRSGSPAFEEGGTACIADNWRSTAASTMSVEIRSMQLGTKSQVGL